MPLYNGVTNIMFGPGIVLEPTKTENLGTKVLVQPVGPQATQMVEVVQDGPTLTIRKRSLFVTDNAVVVLDGDATIGVLHQGDQYGDLVLPPVDMSDTAPPATDTFYRVIVAFAGQIECNSL